jgi:autotransporter passenger strand-loop-strand repeat protein
MTQTVVSSGTTLTVSANQTSNSILVLSGGTLDVASGGFALSNTISGHEFVYGTDSASTVVGGGSQTVSSGGIADAETVDSGGVLFVSAGGVASGFIVGSGSYIGVGGSGADAFGGTVQSGGSAAVGYGGVMSGLNDAGGTVSVVSGGTLSSTTVDGGTVSMTGVIAVGTQLTNGATLAVSGAANASPLGYASCSAVDTFDSGGLISLGRGAVTTGTVLSSANPDVTAEEIVGEAATASGTIVENGLEVVSRGGTVSTTTVDSGGDQIVADYGIAVNDDVLAGATVVVSASSVAFDNSGQLDFDELAGTTMTFAGSLSGGGYVDQSGPGTLDLAGTTGNFSGTYDLVSGTLELASAGAAGSGSIEFVKPSNTAEQGTLLIEGLGDVTNTILGLVSGDTVDLAGLAFVSSGGVSVDGNDVTITQGGISQMLVLPGFATTLQGFTTSELATLPDGTGGTDLTVACFVRGTAIATPCGDQPVERFAIGDLVMTAAGSVKPIRWIGRRSYAGRFLYGRKHLLPVRFAAGSLGDGLPRRDLLVSPSHAMLIDDLLIPAAQLVNGCTILQERGCERVDYFHIELDAHDIVLAEGSPTETFIDEDSRQLFQNASDYAARYGRPIERPLSCAPRVTEGYRLEAIRRRLDGIAPAPVTASAAG